MSNFYMNISGITHEARITLSDQGEDGSAVWSVRIGQEERFCEGNVNMSVWEIVDLAAKAYDE